MGPSGSGKSTLLNVAGLLQRPTSGTVLIDGVDTTTMTDGKTAQLRRTHIGVVFQRFNLITTLTVGENVALPLELDGQNVDKLRPEIEAALAEVGLTDMFDRYPEEISGGQAQRVAIARALSNDPDLLLADEPTGALDSATGRMVMDLFHTLNQEHDVTIAFITHNPELAAETTRIVTMTDGEISGPLAPKQAEEQEPSNERV